MGITRGYQVLSDEAFLYLWFERSKTPAWGLFAGGNGEKPEVTLIRGEHRETMLKVNAKPLQFGDVVIAKTGGGGGYGHPFERDPERVREDVMN
ncbi:hydantoinase B/oxoprolinase family protein, partial [Frankia sp. Cpl3]|nr:hydantoinase B/oxoprolinase family protein [Frankia sp. Cpl3]